MDRVPANFYEENIDEILEIIERSHTTEDAAKHVSNRLGIDITWNAVSAAARRLRRKGYAIPPLMDILGSQGHELEEWDDVMIKLKSPKKGPQHYPETLSVLAPDVVVSIPDIHFPFQDQAALDAMLEYLEEYCFGKDVIIVLLGDVLDCQCLSRYDTPAVRLFDIRYEMKAEIEAAKPFIQKLLRLSNGNLYWIEGNHEGRRQRIIDQNPGLVGLPALEAKTFFEIPEEVTWVPSSQRLKIGNIYYTHGDKIINSRGSAHIANTVLNRYTHQNTLFGHFHCFDMKSRVFYGMEADDPITYMAASCGHLSSLNESRHWVKLPNWHHGFATQEFYRDDEGRLKFNFEFIHIQNGQFKKNGVLWQGRA